ncbi:MAG: hypothetical protein ACLGXA_13635 [Acidobacteriota bacterium]
MKFRNHADNPLTDASREDVRTLAEALSLYRSAMHHIADRESARPFVHEPLPARTHHPRLRLLLAPALAAAVAAGVLVPLYSHSHRHHPTTVTVAGNAAPGPAEARANIDDTELMNQIDSDLSENVPDALRPLADLSDQSTTSNSVSEK